MATVQHECNSCKKKVDQLDHQTGRPTHMPSGWYCVTPVCIGAEASLKTSEICSMGCLRDIFPRLVGELLVAAANQAESKEPSGPVFRLDVVREP